MASFAGIVLTIGVIVALAALLLLSMRDAGRYFERASLSQTQLATVSRIEAVALDGAADRRTLTPLVSAYIASIDREGAMIGTAGTVHQSREMRDAMRMDALARAGPTGRSQLRATVARIADRERREAGDMAGAMTRLRRDTSLLAILLAVAAATLGGVGGAVSLTAKRRLEREVAARTRDLAASNQRLRDVDRSRRLFFAKVSHELRTPVTVMRGEADVALAIDEADDRRDALSRVVIHADALTRRIDEILELSRAEDGHVALVRSPLDLAAVVRDAGATAEPLARCADVVIAVSADGALPMAGDARWLRQALLAILDNAVKFSRALGEVRMNADRCGDALRIRIADAGVGIVADALPRIFDAYYQADPLPSRGGSGLGLALARWVVDQHGGTIRAEAREPRGCLITILLPADA